MRSILVALLMLPLVTAVSGRAAAQATTTGSTTPRDVRNFFEGTAANCATDVSAAVTAAVSAGILTLWLPANCKYIPPSNTIPANLHIIGESSQTSVIASSSPTTNNVIAGAHVIVENVGIQGQFCYAATSPSNVSKTCPVPLYQNVSDTTVQLSSWAYEMTFNLGPTSTAPGAGSASTDIPGFAIQQNSTGGDGIFIATGNNALGYAAAGASGIRIITDGVGDGGIYILNDGLIDSATNQHYGLFSKEYGNNASSFMIRLDRVGDGTDVATSMQIDDNDSAGSTNTRPFLGFAAAHQSSGSLINLFQGTTAFSGDVIIANMGNASGTFTGNFLNFQNSGTKFSVSSAGTVVSGVNKVTAVETGQLSLTMNSGDIGLARITAGSAPGATGGKIELVCGTNAGTAKLIAMAGTSATPVTILDNIGTGVTGC